MTWTSTKSCGRGTGYRRGLLLLALSTLIVSGCSEAVARSPMKNAWRSEVALAEAVLEALSRNDRVALQGFLISRDEYETLLWPEMPDKEYTPFDFVWSLNQANTRKGVAQLVDGFGSVGLELVSVRLPDDPEEYPHFRLYPDVEVRVRNADTGEEGRLSSFDVLIEYDGAWKLLNFDEL